VTYIWSFIIVSLGWLFFVFYFLLFIFYLCVYVYVYEIIVVWWSQVQEVQLRDEKVILESRDVIQNVSDQLTKAHEANKDPMQVPYVYHHLR